MNWALCVSPMKPFQQLTIACQFVVAQLMTLSFFFLKFTRALYNQTLNHYLALVRTTKSGETQKVCTVCTNFFNGDFLPHIDSCIMEQVKKINEFACASCSEENSPSYTPYSHMCSQAHYNNHFRAIGLSSTDNLVHISSLQADMAIVPHFLSLVQLAKKKQYYSTSAISQNWIAHMQRYRQNVDKQTYDIDAHMQVLKNTILEFSNFNLPCYICEGSAARLAGINYVDFVLRVYSSYNKAPREAVCSCGARTIAADREFINCYDNLFKKAEAEIDEIHMDVERDEQPVQRKKNVPVGDTIATLARIMTKKSLFEGIEENDREGATKVLTMVMSLTRIQLAPALNRVLTADDTRSLLFNKHGLDDTYQQQVITRFYNESVRFKEMYIAIHQEYERAIAAAQQAQNDNHENNQMAVNQGAGGIQPDPGPTLNSPPKKIRI